jgi:Cu2+-exporting ATPase
VSVRRAGSVSEVAAEARQAVDAIHTMGIKTILLTGDAQAVADVVARQMGITEVAADLLPEDKLKRIK